VQRLLINFDGFILRKPSAVDDRFQCYRQDAAVSDRFQSWRQDAVVSDRFQCWQQSAAVSDNIEEMVVRESWLLVKERTVHGQLVRGVEVMVLVGGTHQ
jgi:hypothetical protein